MTVVWVLSPTVTHMRLTCGTCGVTDDTTPIFLLPGPDGPVVTCLNHEEGTHAEDA